MAEVSVEGQRRPTDTLGPFSTWSRAPRAYLTASLLLQLDSYRPVTSVPSLDDNQSPHGQICSLIMVPSAPFVVSGI